MRFRQGPGPGFPPALEASIAAALGEADRIPTERRERLKDLARFAAEHTAAGGSAALTFICTHNSRRSHMAQLWAQAAAHRFGVTRVETYSGGTEATAFDPRAVAALRRAGFQIDAANGGDNPHYRVRLSEGAEPMECFSKVYDQPPNPTEGFCAVMTCGEADVGCPIVFGAVQRISIPYEDPKAADGTAQEAAVYDERCRQIAREILYAFSRVSHC